MAVSSAIQGCKSLWCSLANRFPIAAHHNDSHTHRYKSLHISQIARPTFEIARFHCAVIATNPAASRRTSLQIASPRLHISVTDIHTPLQVAAYFRNRLPIAGKHSDRRTYRFKSPHIRCVNRFCSNCFPTATGYWLQVAILVRNSCCFVVSVTCVIQCANCTAINTLCHRSLQAASRCANNVASLQDTLHAIYHALLPRNPQLFTNRCSSLH